MPECSVSFVTGGALDLALKFIPLRIAVLTVSESRDELNDSSGDLLVNRLTAAGHHLAVRNLLKHDASAIQSCAQRWLADPQIDVIITNGGTGLSSRDVLPEIWRRLFERELEGFTVIWHLLSYESVGVSTLQSRACAGIANGTVVYALPGSTGACADGWDKLIALQLDARHRPCSVVELLARLP